MPPAAPITLDGEVPPPPPLPPLDPQPDIPNKETTHSHTTLRFMTPPAKQARTTPGCYISVRATVSKARVGGVKDDHRLSIGGS